MKSESSPNPEMLQRLVDGELTVAEIKTVIHDAGQHPSHWKAIASEFVEDQLFQRQFESLAREVDLVGPAPAKQKSVRGKRNGYLNRFGSTIQKLAVAASVAVAGLVGYVIGGDAVQSLPGTQDGLAPPVIAQNDPAVVSPVTPVELKPEYRMELLTPDGESINGEVDLYRYGDLDRLYANRGSDEQLSLDSMLPASGISPAMRQRLSRSGYRVNESTNYMSGKLEDGRQFVVPVRSIRFDRGH